MSSSPPQRRLEPTDVRLDGQDPYLRVLCVNVFVRDQDRSLRFYVDRLGFSLVIDESYESGGRWLAVAPPDGNTVLALITPKRKSDEYKLIGRSKHTVLVTEDVAAKFDEWGKRGVRFHHPPQTTLWGGILPALTIWMETVFRWWDEMISCATSKPSDERLRRRWRRRDV